MRRRASGSPPSSRLAPPCLLDRGNVDLLHRHHRFEGTPGVIAACGHGVGQRPRRDLPRQAPTVLAPAACALLAAVADNGIPVAVGLFLCVGRNLERERLGLLERRTTVEANTGNAKNGELHRQFIALLAAREVAGRLVNSRHLAVRKRRGIEARRLVRVLVEPEADRVGWRHGQLAPCSISCMQDPIAASNSSVASFETKAEAPAARACSRVPGSVTAVKTMTLVRGCAWAIRRHASSPWMFGRFMSSTTTSGWSRCTASSAALPSAMVPTT